MAHFLARIQGNRGDTTRLGSKASGIVAEVNGWNIGATVRIDHVDGRDVVRVYQTGGSNGNGSRQLVAELGESVAPE